MSELAFQEALARFLSDQAAREAVLSGTDADGAGGTDPVRDRLRALDRDRTALFFRLLLINRLTKIMEALPNTCWALGTQLWSVVQEYNRRCPPRQPKKYQEAMAFAGFLRPIVDDGHRPGPAWLGDVLRYEACVLRLRYLPVRPPPAGDAPALDEHRLATVRPRLSPAAAVLAFDYDIEEITTAFDRAGPVPELSPAPMLMLLQVLPNGEVRQDEVTLAIAELLDLCSGERTLTEVVDEMVGRFGRPGRLDTLRAGCVHTCVELAGREVLILDPAGSPQ